MPEKNENDWIQVANENYAGTQFPNCIGSLDGKHIRIKNPDNCGSSFFNYKQFFSIVLMALVDSQYSFISIDIGAAGKSNDSNVFKRSNFGKKLSFGELKLPSNFTLPNDDNETCMPYVIVADEAFGLINRECAEAISKQKFNSPAAHIQLSIVTCKTDCRMYVWHIE